MQHQITNPGPLLNELGCLREPGYAISPLLEYQRNKIAASVWRIKEWDYYAILHHDYALTCTIADLGYSAMLSVVFLDFKTPKLKTAMKLLWFPFGKMQLPSSSTKGDVAYRHEDYTIEFFREPTYRKIHLHVAKFDGDDGLDAMIRLDSPNEDSMVIATPWKENAKAFYYNQKINCMPASGSVTIGKNEFSFDKETSLGVLDWGRGVWTYKNTWYWSSLSGFADGKRIGFNLGYGFGDTSAASENMVFVDGKAIKLDQVTFEFDPSDLMKPWTFKDNEGKFEAVMKPVLIRQDHTNFVIIKNLGSQVFGYFEGFIKVSSKQTIHFTDLIGFAEEITNHY